MTQSLAQSAARALRETAERQMRAADPSRSAWVSANAGTGKTHVLTTRVLRLLVAGTPPERLLCLTYTKAAAAEMSSRVFARLADWVTAEDGVIETEMGALLGRPATPDELGRARDLFTLAIETPGGLKVQTIHAFCERLLQRFPLEAGVPPGFAILDEETRSALIGEATLSVLAEATDKPDGPLGTALAIIIRYAAEDSFHTLLGEALKNRDWLSEAVRLDDGRRSGLDAAEALYRRALGLGVRDTEASITAERAGVLATAAIARVRDVLRGGSKSDVELADTLSRAFDATSDAQRATALAGYFLTSTGGARARLLTAKLKTDHPDLEPMLAAAQARFIALSEKLSSLAVAGASGALLRLAFAIMGRYDALKTLRAALDFDDLIRAAGSLLRTSDSAQWVLYKLDGGLDHILVDEAQDTSPTQWRVIEALAREFYAGAGARDSQREAPRTVFAVGDEKQSIYGFQGAAPKMFADMGKQFEASAHEARQPFERIPLTLSFRTVVPVLAAVDRVFANPALARGLTSAGEMPNHEARRVGMGGLVEIWETEKPDAHEDSPVWSPLDEVAATPPEVRLAERIAETIGRWLATGEMLVSEGRPVRAGDILVLVRRRRPFADLMVGALKRRRIPVAGADRLRLADQLPVLDLMALADVLLLPEDDLQLAAVLKSPMFGLDDDDLLGFAHARRGSLWSALLKAAATNPRLAGPAEQLKRWRTRADVLPPYEFLVEVLVHDRMRERLIGRLGPEAADPIDELIALALSFDDQAPPSLQGFMTWLRASEREIKRDMEHGRDEVRVMTVHGSKGLEAPIVFLPDTCAAPTSTRPLGLLDLKVDGLPLMQATPFLWPVKGASGIGAVKDARSDLKEQETDEYNRLLYVAMTRPRDRLYVCGFEGSRGVPDGSWYASITAGLDDVLQSATDATGATVRRLLAAQSVPPVTPKDAAGANEEALPLPEWAARPAPREQGIAVPLVPSRLAPLESDAEGDPVEPKPRTPGASDEPPAPSPRVLAGDNRFLRGTLTHALLQHLPGLSEGDRAAAASTFIAARAAALSAAARRSIVTETLAVLAHPEFAAVFGPGSRAEVPLAALIEPTDGDGEPIRITGQIDRLIAGDHEVLIVDFKTNRPPPTDPDLVPDAYVLQLAAYRLGVSRIFPGRPVRAALLWTDGPRLMELSAGRLDEAQKRLFMLGRGNLDAASGGTYVRPTRP